MNRENIRVEEEDVTFTRRSRKREPRKSGGQRKKILVGL